MVDAYMVIQITAIVLSIAAFAFSIFSFVSTRKTDKRVREIEKPLRWKIEVYFWLPNRFPLHKDRLNEFLSIDGFNYCVYNTPVPYDGIVSYEFSAKLKNNISKNFLLSEHEEPVYICIRNNSESRVSIEEFQTKSGKIVLGVGVENKKGILIAVEDFHQPYTISLNYNGTTLPYDLSKPNATGSAIRPQDPL